MLVVGAKEQGIVLDPAQTAALLRLIAELREWNQRFNLTGITDPVDMVRKHLLDSLSVQPKSTADSNAIGRILRAVGATRPAVKPAP